MVYIRAICEIIKCILNLFIWCCAPERTNEDRCGAVVACIYFFNRGNKQREILKSSNGMKTFDLQAFCTPWLTLHADAFFSFFWREHCNKVPAANEYRRCRLDSRAAFRARRHARALDPETASASAWDM